MVVMILIALASSLVFINVGQSGRMKKNRSFARSMVDMCKTARLRSVYEGQPVCLKISPQRRQCWVGFKEEPDQKFRGEEEVPWDEMFADTSGKKSGALSIPEAMRIKAEGVIKNDNDNYLVCFYPDGSSGGGELTLLAGDQFAFTFRVDMLTGLVEEVL